MRDTVHRACDILLSAIGLVACFPLLVVIAAIVGMSMGRPILFRQQRSGYRGVRFTLIKFRSMTDACDQDGMLLPDAQRTTRLGHLLRRSRLDELPELWNILAGRMSIIGPRPLLPATLEAMGDEGVRRGSVRPGLTGWAQICGNASLDNADKLALDLWYINHRSTGLDLLILFKTITLMLFGERVDHTRLQKAWAEKQSSAGA